MPTIFNVQVRCPTCGKKAKKHTESHFGREPYQGNLMILRDRSYMSRGASKKDDRKVYDLTLWDGESYEMYAGYFCTNRCAIESANRGERSRRE